jgi:hypothetical protein
VQRGNPVNNNWTWGLSLITLTIAIHATGVMSIASVGLRIRVRIESQQQTSKVSGVFAIAIADVAAVALLLAALHGIEAALWAGAFWWLGAIDTLADAFFYSIDTIATRGASGLTIAQRWRMLGALEALDGMLVFGISTAFIFAVLQAYWPMATGHIRRRIGRPATGT